MARSATRINQLWTGGTRRNSWSRLTPPSSHFLGSSSHFFPLNLTASIFHATNAWALKRRYGWLRERNESALLQAHRIHLAFEEATCHVDF